MSPLLDTEMIARRLCCTPRHVRNLIRRGELEAIEISKRSYRVTELALNKFMQRNKVDAKKFAE